MIPPVRALERARHRYRRFIQYAARGPLRLELAREDQVNWDELERETVD